MHPGMKGRLLLGSLAIFAALIPALAQTCCSGGVPISANVGLPVDGAARWQLALNYDLNTLRTFKDGDRTLNDNSRERKTHSVLLSAGFNVNSRLSINSLVSFVRQERRITPLNFPETFNYSNGIGDVVILFRYRITNPLNNSRILTLGAGPKLPTGPTDLQNEQGITLNADMQPGSGAWDAVFWANYLHQFSFRPSLVLFSTGTYQSTGTNPSYLGSLRYELGDNMRLDVGLSDRINIGRLILDPSLALRYRVAARDKNQGQKQENTGGEWVFLIPSVSYSISNNLSFQFSMDLPLYSYLQGSQLTPSYRINTGFYYVFTKKSDLIAPEFK